MQFKIKKKTTWRTQIEQDLEVCERYLGEQINQSVEKLVRFFASLPTKDKDIIHFNGFYLHMHIRLIGKPPC